MDFADVITDFADVTTVKTVKSASRKPEFNAPHKTQSDQNNRDLSDTVSISGISNGSGKSPDWWLLNFRKLF